jgi:hypothetical protein
LHTRAQWTQPGRAHLDPDRAQRAQIWACRPTSPSTRRHRPPAPSLQRAHQREDAAKPPHPSTSVRQQPPPTRQPARPREATPAPAAAPCQHLLRQRHRRIRPSPPPETTTEPTTPPWRAAPRRPLLHARRRRGLATTSAARALPGCALRRRRGEEGEGKGWRAAAVGFLPRRSRGASRERFQEGEGNGPHTDRIVHPAVYLEVQQLV